MPSKRVIVTCEEIVDESVIRSDPNRTMIPDFIVQAVCQVPHCCHPSYAQGYYDRDNPFYIEWDKITSDPAATAKWLDEWVYGVQGSRRVLAKAGRGNAPAVGGAAQIQPTGQLWSVR